MRHSRLRWRGLLLVAALGLASSPARPARGDDAASAALEHYQRGTKLFDLRRYREAAREYEAAYELKERSELLFDIGQAYRYAGLYEEAIASYRAFLRREPHAADRADVESRIREMQALLLQARKTHESPPDGTQPPHAPAHVKPIVAVPPAPPPATVKRDATATTAKTATTTTAPAAPGTTARPSPRTLEIAGLVTAAAGVAALAVGAGFAAMAKSTSNQVASAPVFDPAADHRGKLDQGVAVGMLAGGAVLVASGAIVAALGWRAKRMSRFAVVPSIGPNHAGAAAVISF